MGHSLLSILVVVQMHIVIVPVSFFRVEGRGSAVITDVIYSSETSSEEEKPSSQTKEKYESIMVMH